MEQLSATDQVIVKYRVLRFLRKVQRFSLFLLGFVNLRMNSQAAGKYEAILWCFSVIIIMQYKVILTNNMGYCTLHTIYSIVITSIKKITCMKVEQRRECASSLC